MEELLEAERELLLAYASLQELLRLLADSKPRDKELGAFEELAHRIEEARLYIHDYMGR